MASYTDRPINTEALNLENSLRRFVKLLNMSYDFQRTSLQNRDEHPMQVALKCWYNFPVCGSDTSYSVIKSLVL
jgi:hypothetical protein